MKVLDLFSGIGGFSLGLHRAGMTTVGFCEIEEYPRKVLEKRFPNIPIFGDIRKLTGEQIIEQCGPIDLICGGFPCQPFSVTGQRRGTQDDRHLWPEMLRLIQEIRPAWVIGENVAGFASMGVASDPPRMESATTTRDPDSDYYQAVHTQQEDMLINLVKEDLEKASYALAIFNIPACGVGAPHRRERLWIVGNTQHNGLPATKEQRGDFERGNGCKAKPSKAVQPKGSGQ